jgi:hypothetical protein
MAFGGLGLNVLGRSSSMPAIPATVPETEAADLPRGDLPIIGDPIRDLTIWWSNRLTDANRAGLDSLRGRALTPIDPMAGRRQGPVREDPAHHDPALTLAMTSAT